MKGVAILPPMEPMLTIRPLRRRSSGRNACVTAIWPMTLTFICRRRSSSGRNSRGPGTAIPALFTSPRRPRSATALPISATAEEMESSSVTSRVMGVSAAEPRAFSAFPSAFRRTPAKTWNPCLSRRRAQASPIPLEAPVTRTAPRRFVSSSVMAVTSFVEVGLYVNWRVSSGEGPDLQVVGDPAMERRIEPSVMRLRPALYLRQAFEEQVLWNLPRPGVHAVPGEVELFPRRRVFVPLGDRLDAAEAAGRFEGRAHILDLGADAARESSLGEELNPLVVGDIPVALADGVVAVMQQDGAGRQDAPYLGDSVPPRRNQVQHVAEDGRAERTRRQRQTDCVAEHQVRFRVLRPELLQQTRQHARRDIDAADAEAVLCQRPRDAARADTDLQNVVGARRLKLPHERFGHLRAEVVTQIPRGVVEIGSVVEADGRLAHISSSRAGLAFPGHAVQEGAESGVVKVWPFPLRLMPCLRDHGRLRARNSCGKAV